MRVYEISPDTLKGSMTPDLVESKTWLLDVLSKISKDFSTVYILGSWYGNTSILMLAKGFDVEQIINVDTDAESLKIGKKLAKSDKIKILNRDANSLKYNLLDNSGLVINTSCNDIENRGWFEHIPKGTLVVLQGRNSAKATNDYDSLDEFEQAYKLSKVLYRDQIDLEDPETDYQRYMIIGLK